MKTHLFFVFLISSFLGLSMISCHSKNDGAEKSGLSFDSLKINKEVHLFNDTAKPACKFTLDMHYPAKYADTVALSKIQEYFNTTYFGESYAKLTPVVAAQKYTTSYLNNYKQLENEFTNGNSNSDESGNSWMNYVQSSDSRILYNSNDFLSYVVNTYTYEGGAHGMTSTVYQVIDLKLVVPLTLSDIFDDRNLDNVGEIIIETLAKNAGDESDENKRKSDNMKPLDFLEEIGYFVTEIKPTENFYIDDKGITWLYNNYEIAPYAFGRPSAFIPYDQLSIYIKEDSPIYKLAHQ